MNKLSLCSLLIVAFFTITAINNKSRDDFSVRVDIEKPIKDSGFGEVHVSDLENVLGRSKERKLPMNELVTWVQSTSLYYHSQIQNEASLLKGKVNFLFLSKKQQSNALRSILAELEADYCIPPKGKKTCVFLTRHFQIILLALQSQSPEMQQIAFDILDTGIYMGFGDLTAQQKFQVVKILEPIVESDHYQLVLESLWVTADFKDLSSFYYLFSIAKLKHPIPKVVEYELKCRVLGLE